MNTFRPIKTAVIVGSTRPSRRGPSVAEWAASAPVEQMELTIVDLADLDLPLLDEPTPAAFGRYEREATRRFSDLMSGFDAYVLVTPEYNHSTSGVLKNALDHLYAEWRDKPVAFVGYGLDGGTRAVEHLRAICAELGMAGVGPQVSLDLHADFADDRVCSPRERQVEARTRMLETLRRWAVALRPLRAGRDEGEDPDAGARPALDRPELHPAAEDAVAGFVRGIQLGLDRADAALYDARFAADVLWGSPYGATLAGIKPLAEAHRSLMGAGVALDSRYEVVQVRAPAPGVAIAHIRRSGLDEEAFSEMALYVLVERHGRWWLAAGQNTPIAAKPSPLPPRSASGGGAVVFGDGDLAMRPGAASGVDRVGGDHGPGAGGGGAARG